MALSGEWLCCISEFTTTKREKPGRMMSLLIGETFFLIFLALDFFFNGGGTFPRVCLYCFICSFANLVNVALLSTRAQITMAVFHFFSFIVDLFCSLLSIVYFSLCKHFSYWLLLSKKPFKRCTSALTF